MTLNLDKNKKYLLGCSYGPDSMALFFLLNKEGFNFDVAIVNYHLRIESDDEVDGLKKYCKKYDKKIYVLDVKDVPHKNIEEVCRKIRYEFFAELTRKYAYDGVVVAHHQDDLLETYLMQKTRQNCPVFYGMCTKTHIFGVDVYRPLLNYSKTELLEICKSNDIPFMIDKSNQNTVFLRNKIRHGIVSKMSKEEREKMLIKIDEENKDLNSMLSSIDLTQIGKVEYLLSLEQVKFQYAINMLKNKAGSFPDLGKKQAQEIRKILISKKPNVKTNIFSNLYFIKEYDNATFLGESVKNNYLYVINKPSKLDTPYFCLDFTVDSTNRNVTIDDYPISIRNINVNDQYKIKDYSVSARRLLIDWKMPQSLRKIWPVIVSKDGKVIYIPRYRKDFKVEEGNNFYVKIK